MGSHNTSRNQALLLSIKIFFLIFFFFSYKMKICYFFVIVAGVIALGAVTAAREIEIVKRDTAASEDESKLLAEDPNGEAGKASLLAQLTRREADDTTRRPPFHWPPRDNHQGPAIVHDGWHPVALEDMGRYPAGQYPAGRYRPNISPLSPPAGPPAGHPGGRSQSRSPEMLSQNIAPPASPPAGRPAVYQPLTTDHRPLTTDHLPPTTYHQPLTTDHLPPTTYRRPLTADNLLTTYRRSLTADH